jgi:hypothetical protein
MNGIQFFGSLPSILPLGTCPTFGSGGILDMPEREILDFRHFYLDLIERESENITLPHAFLYSSFTFFTFIWVREKGGNGK